MRIGKKEPVLAQSYMDLAKSISDAATCERASHGCVLTTTDFKHVLGLGYNGPASGLPNKCERPDEPGNCGCVHAELNACLKSHQPDALKVAFITGYPCERCALALIQSNVRLVLYDGPAHREMEAGRIKLDQAGINHHRLEDYEWMI